MPILVTDHNGDPQTVATLDDLIAIVASASKQDTANTQLTNILAALSGISTAAGQAAIIAAIENISPGGGGGGDASAANQLTLIAACEAIQAAVESLAAEDFATETSLAAAAAALGTTTGAAVTTDAAGTVQQYLRGIVTRWANALGAGTAAAALRTTSASDDPAVAALGATTGAAVTTDANGTIQQYLRGLVVRWANALGAGTAAAALRVTTASDDLLNVFFGANTDAANTATNGTSVSLMSVAKQISASVQATATSVASAATAAGQTALGVLLGAVNESAAASDTASSGLNGLLKRIAQNLTTLINTITAGDVNDDAADTGPGNKIAGVTRNTLNDEATTSADGDRGDARFTRQRELLIRQYGPPGDQFRQKLTFTSTTPQDVLAAIANVRGNVTHISMTNLHASTSAFGVLKNGATEVWSGEIPPGGREVPFRKPEQGAVNTAWTFETSTAVTSVIVWVYGYKSR